jgi:hypothetical protein
MDAIMIDPLSILAVFGPLAVKLGESVISKFISPDTFKPSTIEDYIKMKELDIKNFEVLNNAGGTNPTYPWVDAVVKLMRPAIATAVIGTWSVCKFVPGINCGPEVDNFAAAIGFYLFGDRTLFYSSKK